MIQSIDFSHETDPAEVGMSREGVRRAAAVFEQQFADDLNIGGQFVVIRRGKVVLDRVVGLKRLGTTQPVMPDTPFQLFSMAKPLTAVCVHTLVDQGLVDLDASVAEYWPEFGTKGKETATVAQTLLHQSGVPGRGMYQQIFRWRNWDSVVGNVANLTAEWEPGSRTAYHLVNNGFILGEIVRRVTGVMIDEYMREEIFEPLGMKNSYLGLPIEKLAEASELYSAVPDQRSTVLLFRSARHWVMPAATLNASARDVARFYQMMLNKGIYNGHRVLKEDTVREATKLRTSGFDETIGDNMNWAYGFSIGGIERPPQSKYGVPYGRYSTFKSFGHSGQRSSTGWANREEELIMVFTTNQLIGDTESVDRQEVLSDAVWEALVEHNNPKLA